jgi:hypothetical protein
MTLPKWTRPPCYIGAEWHGWHVFLSQNRDSSLLDKSNFQCALKAVEHLAYKVATEDGLSGVQVVRENHWACGWVEWIAIHESNKEAIAEAERILERLEGYPVVDEHHWGNLEHDAYLEAWESLGHDDFIATLESFKLIEEGACDDCTKEATLEAFEALIPSGEYHSDGTPNIGLAIQNAKRGGLNDEVCAILNLETEKGEA